MKIKKIKLKNFRSYKDEIIVEFNNLTVFVGKNDAGKSTILEALDLFFNEGQGTVKYQSEDLNIKAAEDKESKTEITVCFCDLPNEVVIDASNITNFKDEYLLNLKQELEIKKVFTKSTVSTYIEAYHPTAKGCENLHSLNQNKLREIVRNLELTDVDESRNASMRQAIWSYYDQHGGLNLQMVELGPFKKTESSIISNMDKYLPMYYLLQADRKNMESDEEIQDPLRFAVKQILQDDEIQQHLQSVADKVKAEMRNVIATTLDKIKEMDPSLIETLNPKIPEISQLKWSDVFKNISLTGDNDIPINKRGSGTRRLILLNFFRADVERRLKQNENHDVIYAIEEPETSQHTNNQKKIIKAICQITDKENENAHVQVILTTHSPQLVKMLNIDDIRLVKNSDGHKKVTHVPPGVLAYRSLNETNYLAFEEISYEYHDELYSEIYEVPVSLKDEYESAYAQYGERPYKRQKVNKKVTPPQISYKDEKLHLSKYIRHLIHHPENEQNKPFTPDELKLSTEKMREFLLKKKQESKNE